LWLHSLKVAQLLRSAACLHTNQSRSYLNHLVLYYAVCDRSSEMKAFDIQSNGKKVVFAASLSHMPVERMLLSRINATVLGEMPRFENNL